MPKSHNDTQRRSFGQAFYRFHYGLGLHTARLFRRIGRRVGRRTRPVRRALRYLWLRAVTRPVHRFFRRFARMFGRVPNGFRELGAAAKKNVN